MVMVLAFILVWTLGLFMGFVVCAILSASAIKRADSTEV